MFRAAMSYGPVLPGDAPARNDRNRLSLREADLPAEEHDRHIVGVAARSPAREAAAAEREDALALEKEVALLGEEDAEPREVDLLRSSSICAKSVLTVTSAVRPRERPYLRSTPRSPVPSLTNGCAPDRSVVDDATA